MKKQELKKIISAQKRNDVVVANFTEKELPCIILADTQPIYLLTFRFKLALMPQNNVLTFGRADYCDYTFPEFLEKISRLHCYIEKCNDGTYRLHDVSKNGTLAQTKPQRQTLKDKLRHMFAAI